MIKFSKGLKSTYLTLEKNPDQLYFCTDTRELFKGDQLYTEGIRYLAEGEDFPEVPAQGVVYISTVGVGKVYVNGEWDVVILPFQDSLAGEKTDADKESVPTSYAVKDVVETAVTSAMTSVGVVKSVEASTEKAGTIVVTKGDDSTSEVVVKGAVVNPTYDAETRTITLPYADGTESLVIALGKDTFLDVTKENKFNEETGNIELWLNDGSKVEIPASALIDVYTGDETATSKTTVSDTNKITVDVKVSNAQNNAITVVADVVSEEDGTVTTKGGLFLDLTPVNEAIATINATIGTVSEGQTVVGLIETAQTTADNAQADVDALEAYVGVLHAEEGEEAIGTIVEYIDKKDAEVKAVADKAQEEVDALETYVGTIPTEVVEGEDVPVAESVIAYVDKKDAEVMAEVDATNATIGTVAEGETVVSLIEKAQTSADNAQTEVDALEVLVGTIPTENVEGVDTPVAESVIAYIDKKDAEVRTLAEIAQTEVDALEVYVGALPEDTTATSVVAYVDEKVSNVASSSDLDWIEF